MEGMLAIIAGGLLLGLAGSLHCACMCGGIASGALFLLHPASPPERMISLLLLQSGRITTYAAAGGALAAATSVTIDPTLTAASYRVLQYIGAAALMWVGLSTAGMLPRLALPATGSLSVSTYVDRAIAPLRGHRVLGPFALGLSWGLTPCPMVYAALFSAALTGAFSGGALWMTAFGLGTLPGVLGAVLGVSFLARLKGRAGAEMLAGLLIAVFGFSTLYFGWPAGPFCVTP